MPSDIPHIDAFSSQPESELSEPQLPSAIESPSTSVESEQESDAVSEKDAQSSGSGSDVDAEGSADDEYDLGPSATARSSHTPSTRSSSSPDRQSRKRKYNEEDLEDAIAQHPELYGVRRSVRVALNLVHDPVADVSLQVRSRIVPRRVVSGTVL
jgi:chromodomain-helicase-DNA-binding protein 1